jgi:ABC-type sugar transport system ATPase subunit
MIYVTHDQVEAMTMGDRIVVMKDGVMQQVRHRRWICTPSGQPVRRRLHRQPGR